MHMPKRAISVTLETENLTWLKARTRSGRARSVSDVLDRLVTEARTQGAAAEIRSVVGSIDVDPDDPLLLKADDTIRTLFAESLARPSVVKEKRATSGTRSRTRRG
jgi:hypothetical protein